MTEIFTKVLQAPDISHIYLIIDDLDECVTEDLPKLLEFIKQQSSVSSHIKWIISSRNWPDIERHLDQMDYKVGLSLELNAATISRADCILRIPISKGLPSR